MNSPRRPVSQEQVVRALLARWGWIALGVLAGALLFSAFGWATTPSYTANSTVVVRPISQNPFDTANSTPDKQLTMPNEVAIGHSQAVFQRVVNAFKGGITVDELRRNAVVTNPSNTTVLDFAYTSGRKSTAASVANVLAQSYLDERQAQAKATLGGQVKSLQTSIDELNRERTTTARQLGALSSDSSQRDVLTAELAQVTGSLRDVEGQQATLSAIDTTPGNLVEPANVPAGRDGPSLLLLLIAGAIVGGVGGLIAAILSLRLNNRVRHAYELSGLDNVGVVMELPRASSRLTGEAWRLLAVRLHNRGVGSRYRLVTVTSPGGEADRLSAERLAGALRDIGLTAEPTMAWPPGSGQSTTVFVSAIPMSNGAFALNSLSRADAAVVLFSQGSRWQRLRMLYELLEEARVPVIGTGIVRGHLNRSFSSNRPSRGQAPAPKAENTNHVLPERADAGGSSYRR